MHLIVGKVNLICDMEFMVMKKYAAIRGDRTSSGAKLLGEGVSTVEDVDGGMMPY
jgi:uncharacterized Zn-binding protein involved in type VI secretion